MVSMQKKVVILITFKTFESEDFFKVKKEGSISV